MSLVEYPHGQRRQHVVYREKKMGNIICVRRQIKGHRGKWNQQWVYWTMTGNGSNAESLGEWIRKGFSRESYLWVSNPLLYPVEPAGTTELGNGGEEQLDCGQKVRWSGKSTWNVWDQTLIAWEECVDIVLLISGDRWQCSVIRWFGSGVCSWWWLWLPDNML